MGVFHIAATDLNFRFEFPTISKVENNVNK